MPGRIPNEVRDLVIEIGVNNPDWGAVRVHKAVEAELPGSISPRTVGTILRDLPNLSPVTLRAMRYVRWPETFERGDLPWAAAAASVRALKLVSGRPLRVQTAEWFWRLSEVDPEGDESLHFLAATWLHLSSLDSAWHDRVRRRVEDAILGRKPWAGLSHDIQGDQR